MEYLRENTNTLARREREVKHGSFPEEMGDLTGMSSSSKAKIQLKKKKKKRFCIDNKKLVKTPRVT